MDEGSAYRVIRRAVRAAVLRLPAEHRRGPVLVACSGGADSLALAAATADVHPRVHAAVVDHGLQEGSADTARRTVTLLEGLGITAAVHRVDVDLAGGGGTEAAARRARYAALRAARPAPDAPVLLGHTLDDQAETVLLGLGRGSGARSLAGMRAHADPWVRPLLGVRRATTRAACAERDLPVWDDPHNADPRFTRVRLRHEVLPLLEEVLHGGVAEALTRTAAQLREDVDALDAVAAGLLDTAAAGGELVLAPLAAAPPAVRKRVLRAWMTSEGVRGLTAEHLVGADEFAAHGPDRSGLTLPGGLELVRAHGRLALRPAQW